MGVELEDTDVAFRCNLVTLSEESDYATKTMIDYSSDEISSEESAQLIEEVKNRLGSSEIKFYPGISYRHLMVWQNGALDVNLTPPHDISERKINDHLPRGPHSEILLRLMVESSRFYLLIQLIRLRVNRGLRPLPRSGSGARV